MSLARRMSDEEWVWHERERHWQKRLASREPAAPVLEQVSPNRVVLTHDDREMCVICSELPATEGIYCKRCARGLEDDRYERECNR